MKIVVDNAFFYYIITMLLDVQNLNAGLEDGKQILNDLNIQIGQGETHVLMGPNGAGKSNVEVAAGVIRIHGKKLHAALEFLLELEELYVFAGFLLKGRADKGFE